MLPIIGILIVVGSVFGGYLMHGGHMEVLYHLNYALRGAPEEG